MSKKKSLDEMRITLAAAQAKSAAALDIARAEQKVIDTMTAEMPKISKADEDREIEEARKNLRLYGTVSPPKEALYATQTAVCTHCGEEKKIASEFGLKTQWRGKKGNKYKTVRPQSWCRECRNSKDSHPARFAR